MAGMQSKAAKQPAGRGTGPGSAKAGAHHVTEDTKALVDHIAENPLLYAAAAGFVALCVVAGVFIMLSRQAAVREEMTQLARAVVNEDPALQAAQLEPLGREAGGQAATAAYLAGEAEIKAGNYAKAEEHLQRVIDNFAASEYAPNAMDALGFLAENRGDYEAALTRYQQITEKWPDSFMARIAPARIGRVLESLDRKKDAVKAYCDQFRKFPRAWTTSMAMTSIDKLAKSDDGEIAAAAKDGFKQLSQEYPALFEELFTQYFVPAEEVAPVEESPVAATAPEAAPAEAAPVAPAGSDPSADQSQEPAPAADGGSGQPASEASPEAASVPSVDDGAADAADLAPAADPSIPAPEQAVEEAASQTTAVSEP